MDDNIILSLIEYSSWPLVVLICTLLLRSEIIALLRRLRGLRAGPIELQLSEQLHNQRLPKEQLTAIGNLTNDEIDIFLLVSFTDNPGFNYSTALPPDVFKSQLIRLQEAGLLQILNPEDPGTNLRHNITPTGKRFRTLLVNSAASLVREAV